MARCNVTKRYLYSGDATFTVCNGKGISCAARVRVHADNALAYLVYVHGELIGLLTKHNNEFYRIPQDCPNCGAEMKLRTRRSDNQPFWGCCAFPQCRGIKNLNYKEEQYVKAFQFALDVIFAKIPKEKYPNAYVDTIFAYTLPANYVSAIGPGSDRL